MSRRPDKLLKFLRDVQSEKTTLSRLKDKYGNIVYSYYYSGYVKKEDDGTLVLTEKGRAVLSKYGAENAD